MGIGERGNNGLREGGNCRNRKTVTLVTALADETEDDFRARSTRNHQISVVILSKADAPRTRSSGAVEASLQISADGGLAGNSLHPAQRLRQLEQTDLQTLWNSKGSFDSAASSRCEDAAALRMTKYS